MRAVPSAPAPSPTFPTSPARPGHPPQTRDGNDLPLIDLAVNGNQITARFAGGITAELWQASGSEPAELPAFGKTATYNALPINSQKRYGVLLVQNGNTNTIFSSFSDANPGAETQMVRLGSDPKRFVLGIEDIAVTSVLSDRDFNDNIVILSGISLGLF